MVDSHDGLTTLEALLQRVSSAEGDHELKTLVQAANITQADLNRVEEAASGGRAWLQKLPTRLCCQALPELCYNVQPPLFSTRALPKLRSSVASATSRTASVRALCTPQPTTEADVSRCRRVGAFVAQLLELLARI